MARRPRPWQRKGRGWFVTIDGKQVPLGNVKKAAFKKFYELMNRSREPGREALQMIGLLDDFLEWNRKNRAPATYRSYKEQLQSLIDFLPDGFLVEDLRPHHIQKWLDAHPGWSNTTGHTHVTAAQRAFNWSVKMGLIPANPIAFFEKPRREARDEIITPDEYAKIQATVMDDEFRDLLTLHWESGCRPQESLRVEASFVDLSNSRWVFPINKSKGKKRPRIVYLNDKALEITERRMKENPHGAMLRNTSGEPWTKDSVGCRFHRLQKHVGRRYCLYVFRHSFATRMLESGLDALTVALLLGHSNPAMLSTTYQHLAHNPGHIRDQLKRASE